MMEVLYQKRGTGKSCTMINLSARNNIPIAVVHQVQKQHLEEQAQKLGLTIPEPIIIKQLSDLEYCGDIYIDDFDVMMNKLTDGHIKYVSMSYETKFDDRI